MVENPIFTKTHRCSLPCSKYVDFELEFKDTPLGEEYTVSIEPSQIKGLYVNMVKYYLTHKVQQLCKDTGVLPPLFIEVKIKNI